MVLGTPTVSKGPLLQFPSIWSILTGILIITERWMLLEYFGSWWFLAPKVIYSLELMNIDKSGCYGPWAGSFMVKIQRANFPGSRAVGGCCKGGCLAQGENGLQYDPRWSDCINLPLFYHGLPSMGFCLDYYALYSPHALTKYIWSFLEHELQLE